MDAQNLHHETQQADGELETDDEMMHILSIMKLTMMPMRSRLPEIEIAAEI